MPGRKRGNVQSSKKEPSAGSPACCKIEALVTLDARGQILLPKEVRERAGLQPGDKLAVISYESGEKISRITLVKAEEFAETAREMLGPMMGMLAE
ncbi:MAG: AbrB family transcriptional regulator [Candidatus Abyssobacteria bacterium SURF_17]|uniref:AbrB family transcriptional regulator n=1 Tax=Candidatus Abyssobacteria bacterium SURF_17 TaxID=2093361 RepID=A0A419EPA3_9BACT|nr:MAG: AbrB family transcriptional regulator [Candidatus Abyssubacteria bacterium SURF_17]